MVGWFAGWTMILAQIVTLAAAAIALQVVLPSVWTGFQLIGTDPSLASSSGSANAVMLGVILLAITTTINALSVRVAARVNSIGVICELVGLALMISLLFVHAERGPSVVLNTSVCIMLLYIAYLMVTTPS